MHKRDQTLSYDYERTLRSFHSFSPLLKGDQFHAYQTSQAQTASVALYIPQPTKTRTHSLNRG